MRKNATQIPFPNSPPRTSKLAALHIATLTGLISLALCTPAPAADFTGRFKGVTITDSAGVNKPPTAVFTYRQDGQTLTFDANGSADTDGSITRYKWDFGNGTTSEGATATYTLTDTVNLQVTLTVVDNNNGVALSQQTISTLPKKIFDDFSTNTTANYTAIKGGISVSSGIASFTTPWTANIVYSKTSTGSDSHYVQAKITAGSSSPSGSTVGVRCNGTSGYYLSLAASNDRMDLIKFTGSSYAYVAGSKTIASDIVASTNYTVKLTVSGSTFHAYIDLNGDGDFDDTNEDLGTWTDSTYPSGQYVVLGGLLSYGGDYKVDNLSGGAL